jgi:hypothetical protein
MLQPILSLELAEEFIMKRLNMQIFIRLLTQ